MSATGQDSRPARRRPGRPRGQDSAVVRESAMRAAIDLIARQGFAATSMAQVAAAAGISPSGLVHHFPSKKALLGAVLEHRDTVDSFPREEFGDGPWADFDHLVHVAWLNMERRQLVLLYTSMMGEAATSEHPAHEWMKRHYAAVVGMLVRRRPRRSARRSHAARRPSGPHRALDGGADGRPPGAVVAGSGDRHGGGPWRSRRRAQGRRRPCLSYRLTLGLTVVLIAVSPGVPEA